MAIDAAACLSAGECIVATKGVFNILVGFSVFAGILLVFVMMIFFFTPAGIFLKAKFKKGLLIYEVNRGQAGRFVIAKSKFQGIADVPGTGPYIISENSHTIEQKSKLPFYFGFGEFGATLPLEYPYVIQKLRQIGEKITNIEDLGKLVGLYFDVEAKIWKRKDEKEMDESELKKMTELKIHIQPYKTIKIHDLAHMFPFNITPALVESKTQHLIGLKMKMFNKMNMQYVLMFIMILMGATLAAVIAFKFLKTGDTTETIRIIESAVQSVPGNLSG